MCFRDVDPESLDVFGKVAAFSACLVRYFSCHVHFETHELSDGNIFTVGSKRCRSAEFSFFKPRASSDQRGSIASTAETTSLSAPNASVARKDSAEMSPWGGGQCYSEHHNPAVCSLLLFAGFSKQRPQTHKRTFMRSFWRSLIC